MLRTSMGSSVRHTNVLARLFTNEPFVQVQLPTYNWTKSQLVSRGFLPANSIWTYLASSSVSGVCVVSVAFAFLMLFNIKDS
jgi:hypothetical protein